MVYSEGTMLIKVMEIKPQHWVRNLPVGKNSKLKAELNS